ncbi:MAG: hypothetical protein WA030_04365 [Candidatus Microsaccharimonas sp.]
MPTFIFNKLVRDKPKDLYVELNQQTEYKKLTSEELTVSELADIQQVVQDLMTHVQVSNDE